MEDSEAIARLRSGDIGGLEHLVACYQVQAVRAAYLIIRDRNMAEDIVQAAFLRISQRISQFDPSRPFAPWFIRCVVNDTLKQVSRHRPTTSLDLAATVASPTPSPEEIVGAAETSAAIWQSLGQLSPNQRAAIVLRYYVGMSEAEMAQHLGIPPGTVKWRLHAARERLRQLLPTWLRPEPSAHPTPPTSEGERQ